MMLALIRVTWLVCVFAGLAACDASGDPGGSTASPSAMSDAEILAIGKQIAQCIRDNGVPDFPDPLVDKGKLTLPQEAVQTLEQRYSQQVLEQAEQSCQTLMDRLPEGAVKSDEQVEGDRDAQEPGPGDVEALKRFAQCLRENGIPEWPDPNADGSFPLKGSPLAAEGKSERFGRAVGACEQHWNGGIRLS